jgi:hypothetical protein
MTNFRPAGRTLAKIVSATGEGQVSGSLSFETFLFRPQQERVRARSQGPAQERTRDRRPGITPERGTDEFSEERMHGLHKF